MVPYQIYQALTDQRSRELAAAAERHQQLVTAGHSSTEASEVSTRLKDGIARMVALLHVRRGARARSSVVSPTGAGPMGCCA